MFNGFPRHNESKKVESTRTQTTKVLISISQGEWSTNK
jgi:hypothetical protein